MESYNEVLIEAERSVLGAIFLKPEKMDEILYLEPRDFTQVRHQNTYEAMRYLAKKNLPIDLVTVAETCQKFGGIQSVGGVSYLTELAEGVPTAENIGYYAGVVRSHALERRIQNTGTILNGLSRSDYETDEDFFADAEKLIADLRPQNSKKMESVYSHKEEYLENKKKPVGRMKTGFKYYDSWARGLWRGWLFVSAGRPSVGKTAMLLQRLHGVAEQQEGQVLLFSQEMDKDQVIDRWISNLTGISYKKITDGNLDGGEWELINRMYETFQYLPIHVQDSSGITIDEVKATAKEFRRKYGKIAVIAVDYLQIMKIPKAKNETRAEAIGNVTREAKNIARELKCCFIMLSQMTRDGDNGMRPTIGQLKESSSIEQDADVIEFLWKDPEIQKAAKNIVTGTVVTQTFAKGRDIGLNEFELLFMGWKQKFIELEPDKVKEIKSKITKRGY